MHEVDPAAQAELSILFDARQPNAPMLLSVGRAEIGVITHPEHRRRGLGHVLCSFLAAFCEDARYPTTWSCNVDNHASVALARKLGYQRERSYAFLDF